MNVVTLSEFRMRQLERVILDALAPYLGIETSPSNFEPLVKAAVDAMTELERRTLPKHERLRYSEYRRIVVKGLREAVPWMVPEGEP